MDQSTIQRLQLADQEAAQNKEARFPIVWARDRSGSTAMIHDEVNAFIEALAADARADEVACEIAEFAYITFETTATVDHPFAPASEFYPKPVEVGVGTSLGAGLRLSVQELNSRKDFYVQNGIASPHRPWLVVFFDGMPGDRWEDIADEVHQLDANKEVAVFAVYLRTGSDEMSAALHKKTLKRITPRVLELKNLNFRLFRKWVLESVRQVSVAQVGDNVQVKPPDDLFTM